MDLSTLKPVERVIPITHPGTGEELGVNVTVISLQDSRTKSIKRQIQNEKLKLEQRGKTFKAEDVEENLHIITFSAMVGWEWKGDNTFNGGKPEFNKPTVLKVFKELPWFYEQIQNAIGDEQAFFTTSEVASNKQSESTAATK